MMWKVSNFVEQYILELEELCEDIRKNGFDDDKQIDKLEEIIHFILKSQQNLNERLDKLER